MHHEILGELSQWLRIEMQSESIQGDYTKLLCKSEQIKTTDKKVFFGTGWLIFSSNGKIKEFYLHAADNITVAKTQILASDITTKMISLSTNYVDLVEVTGPGTVFVHGNDFIEFYLEEQETIETRTGSITALDSTVAYELESEFSVLSGPGAVVLNRFAPAEKKEGFFFDRS